MEILTRKEAGARGMKKYCDGNPCSHCGLVKEKLTSQGWLCVDCGKIYRNEWRKRNQDKVNRSAVEYRRKNAKYRTYHRDYSYRSSYGISIEEYREMFRNQEGRCAICGIKKLCDGGESHIDRLHIDHCHDSGQVRGLLCFQCNTGLGRFSDDPDVLESAIAYLRKHGA